MKEIVLKIPDKKYNFIMKLIKELGIEVADEINIPEEHKSIVRERIKNTYPEDMIPWDEARKKLKFKGKA